MSSTFQEEVTFQAGFKNPGGYITKVKQSERAQMPVAEYMIPWTAFRVWDAMETNLPGAGANDDLGLEGNTFGTGSPSLETGDLKAAGATTRYARFQCQLPAHYDDAETVNIKVHAGMNTTISDTTATVDLEVYESDSEAGIGSDLCTTAAQSINSLTFADFSFVVTASGLVAGDWLDCRIAVAVNDAATGTAVIGEIGYVALVCDIR